MSEQPKRPWNGPKWNLEIFDSEPCDECGGDPVFIVTGPAHSAHDGSPMDYVIASLCPSNEACGVDQQANARLIAAAPELYEALEDLVSRVDYVLRDDAEHATARAALAKARGD